MATKATLTPWVNRKATKNTGVNLVVLRKSFVADELKYSGGTTALASGDHVPLFEIPFGSTVLSATANVKTGTTGACTFTLGVLGFTSYLGTTITDNASTGNDVDGLMTAANLDIDTEGLHTGTGALIGLKLDERVFSDADELNKPLYITLEGGTFTAQPDAGVWDVNVLVLCP